MEAGVEEAPVLPQGFAQRNASVARPVGALESSRGWDEPKRPPLLGSMGLSRLSGHVLRLGVKSTGCPGVLFFYAIGNQT